MWLLRRVAWYCRPNLVLYLIIQSAVIFVMTRFLLHINVHAGRPQVVYMLIDAGNGTRTRIIREGYSSHSSNKGEARGLSGAGCDKVRAEEVAAYHAEKFNEVLERAGYPMTTTTGAAIATFVI